MMKLFKYKKNIGSPLIFFFLLFNTSLFVNAQFIEYASPVKLPKGINSEAEESLPLLAPDNTSLYFVRTLSEKNVKGKKGGQDVWISKKDNKGNWSEAINDFNRLNSRGNNAVIGFNATGSRVYLLNNYRRGSFFNKGISYSDFKYGSWSPPTAVHLKNLNPQSLFYGFYMHPSEKILLVSMEGKESMGKEDLYVILKDNSGEWGDPIHLGNTVNTAGYEIAPFLSQDGTTLYFSSNGHKGLGDADIFVSKRLYKSWNIWTKPENLGDSINSKKFDAYFSITPDSTIFFTSNRAGGLTDVYQSKMTKKDVSEILNLEEIEESPTPDPNKKLQRVSNAEVNEFLGVSIPRLVYFQINSFDIKPEDKELIYYIAGKIENEKKYFLEIVGHTDEEGSAGYNMKLSVNRAEAVKEYFTSLGINPNRMIVVGKGASQPLEKSTSEDKRNEKNRRVEINFLK